MRYYNTGWCNYCNGNFCPCSCGCGSCGCSCGRKTVLQQSKSSCCNSSSGTKFCKETQVYLTSNFTVPNANIDVEITVSDSSKLYFGQGIQISTFYFQITEIVDSRTIKIAHNGTATAGTIITAINATYGCYNYPIYYVGIVEIAYDTDEVEGVDGDLEPIEDSISDVVFSFTYGYLGPNKIQFNLSMSFTIPSDPIPTYLRIPLPDAESEISAVFSAIGSESGNYYDLIAFKDDIYLYIGGPSFENGAQSAKVSGEYGV